MQDGAQGQTVAKHGPIGVFDSGVGGLSVLRAIRDELPGEHLVYVADSGCAPYGERSAAFVVERALTITDFLVRQGAKAIVVACNTATGAAVESLRERFTIPIVAIEPAVKPAAARTRSRVVGVLATTGTLSSPNVGKLLANYGADVEFVIQPCPGLADQVEKGDLDSDQTRDLVRRYVQPIVDKGADILVLGCTHYPFLRHAHRRGRGLGHGHHRSCRRRGPRAAETARSGRPASADPRTREASSSGQPARRSTSSRSCVNCGDRT